MCGDRDPKCAQRPRLWDSGPVRVAQGSVDSGAGPTVTARFRLHIPSPRLRGVLHVFFQLWGAYGSGQYPNAATVTATIYPVALGSGGQRMQMTPIVSAEAFTSGKGYSWEFASGVRDYDVEISIPDDGGGFNSDLFARLEVQPDSAMGNAAWEELYDEIALEAPSTLPSFVATGPG